MAMADAEMDEAGTIFYLIPETKHAYDIVQDPANRARRCLVDGETALRIGLDQQPKMATHLVRFGRHDRNDVILGNRFSRNDQCYFDFNKDTGELLLHDISEKATTQLYTAKAPRLPQIWKAHRQCVVLLGPDLYHGEGPQPAREWILEIQRARFRLTSPRARAQDEAALARQKLAFAHQPDPERTAEGTLERMVTLALQSLRSQGMTTTVPSESTVTLNPRNMRFRAQLEPEEEDQIRYTRLKPLGSGGQGDVHRVVDMYDGSHHACKVIAVKAEAPGSNISSEQAFRAKVETEVRLVQKLEHHHIVPYLQCQGFRGSQIEIFMPIYDGSLQGLIPQWRAMGPRAALEAAAGMFFQILGALDYVHSRKPPVIHRDIKPGNILYQGGQDCPGGPGARFLLTDFGIAKVVDASRTAIGTRGYAAPEVILQSAEQTPKVDIYSLGATLVNCLVEVKVTNATSWQEWHHQLQMPMKEHAPQLESMLSDDPSSRPTAAGLRSQFSPWRAQLEPWAGRSSVPGMGPGGLPTPEPGNSTSKALTPMEWTRAVATANLPDVSRATRQNDIPDSPTPDPKATGRPTPSPTPEIPDRQPRSRRGGSRKPESVADGQEKARKRGDSSRNGQQQEVLARPARVPKRKAPTTMRRPKTRSVTCPRELLELQL